MRVPATFLRAAVGALPLVILLFVCSGCGFRTYEPKPLDPPASAAEVSARSLDAPALRDYLVSRGVAADPWPRTDWNLADLTWVAFYYSPELDAARGQVTLSRAGEVTAAQRPNPAIQIGGQHHSETAPPRDSPWTVSVILDLPIVTGGKRDAQMARAHALTDAALLDVAAAAWQVRVRVQARYLDCYGAAEEVRLAGAETALREEEAAIIDRRVDRGFASASDAAAARTRLAEARLAQARAAARLVEAQAGLAQSLGVPLDSINPSTLSFRDVERLPADDQRDLRALALQNRLDIRRGLADYALAEAGLQLEIARQYPDLVLRPGYIWDQGDRIWALGSFLLLPLLNRNEGPIQEAEARRALEADRFLGLQARTIGAVEARQAGYAVWRRELVAADAVRRDANERTARTQRRFDAGDADRLERTRARIESVIAERLALTSRSRGLQAHALLEDAVQMPLDGSVTPVADPVTPRLADFTR